MSETYVKEREVNCSAINKSVYQKLNYVLIRTLGSLIADKKLTGTFCSGHPNCGKNDCQLVVGKTGKNYSVPLED